MFNFLITTTISIFKSYRYRRIQQDRSIPRSGSTEMIIHLRVWRDWLKKFCFKSWGENHLQLVQFWLADEKWSDFPQSRTKVWNWSIFVWIFAAVVPRFSRTEGVSRWWLILSSIKLLTYAYLLTSFHCFSIYLKFWFLNDSERYFL